MILPVLALIAVTFSPPAPTVGDLITVEFEAPVALDQSEEYEIVAQQGNMVTVRTFRPESLMLSGTTGGTYFRNLRIPVASVLKPDDDMAPAPLIAPRPVPYERRPFIAIAIAVAAAMVAWAAVWLRARKPRELVVRGVLPEERFRRVISALISDSSRPLRYAVLADETRTYLAATRAELGSDLTTTELLRRVSSDQQVIADILRQGDFEKFSPSGASAHDFADLARRALVLASPAPTDDREDQAA